MRNWRLDYTKGIAIILVLGSHLMPITFAPDTAGLLQVGSYASLAYSYFLSTLAVPMFYLVALAVYYMRPAPGRRLRRIAGLYVFWVTFAYVAWWAATREPPRFDFQTLRLGGPSLVGAEATVFYFLFDLFLVIALGAALDQASHAKPQVAHTTAQLLVAIPCVTFWALILLRIRLPLWSVLNFLPFVGLAYLLRGDAPTRPWRWYAYAAVASIGIESLAFYRLNGTVFSMPNYARTSVVFGSLALFLYLQQANIRRSWSLETIGRHSLGIFALHTYVQYWLSSMMPAMEIVVSGGAVKVSLGLTLTTLLVTACMVLVMAKTPLRRFVT